MIGSESYRVQYASYDSHLSMKKLVLIRNSEPCLSSVLSSPARNRVSGEKFFTGRHIKCQGGAKSRIHTRLSSVRVQCSVIWWSNLPNSNCASNHQSLATSCSKSNLTAPGLGLFSRTRAPLERLDDISDGVGQADLSLSARSSILATSGGVSITAS